MARFKGRTFRLSVLLVLNFLCFIMEIIVGAWCHSMVLTADAFNVLSDFLGVVIALVSMKIAAKGPSKRNTFGWTRCDVLGALINAVFMIALCVTIFISALQRFLDPELVDQPVVVAIAGAAGMVINLIGLFLLKEYRSVPKQGEMQISAVSVEAMDKSNSSSTTSIKPQSTESIANTKTGKHKGASSHMNMYGAFLHVLGDALGSVVVIICALVDWKVDVLFLQYYLDPILSILMAILLTASSIGLMKESSLTLLQAVPTNVNLMNLKSLVMAKSRHIIEIKDLHVWQLTSDRVVASIRILFDETMPYEKLIALVNDIENSFYEEGVHVVTVHPEIVESGDAHSLIVNGIRYESSPRGRCDTCCIDEKDVPTFLNRVDLRSSRHSDKSEGTTVWM